jgi:hypothetical protein
MSPATCINICMYICVYVNMSPATCINICMYTCINVSHGTCINICMYINMSHGTCIYICMYINMSHETCINICMYINAVTNSFLLHLYLSRNFITLFLKLNINYTYPLGQPPPPPTVKKVWVRACVLVFTFDTKFKDTHFIFSVTWRWGQQPWTVRKKWIQTGNIVEGSLFWISLSSISTFRDRASIWSRDLPNATHSTATLSQKC